MSVREGEELSATAWNRLEQVGEWFYRNVERGRPTPIAPFFGNPCIIQVKNISGQNLRQGEILEFTGDGLSLTIPERTNLLLDGNSPDLESGFGVLVSPLRNSTGAEAGIGDIQVSGSCVALVNVTDTGHNFAAPASGNAVLQSAAVGPVRIVFKPSGTGEKACGVTLLDATNHFVGVANSTITDGGTGTVTTKNSAFTTSLGEVPGCYNQSGASIVGDTKVAGFLIRGVPIVWPMAGGAGGDTVDMVQAGTDEPNGDGLHLGAVSRFDNGILTQPSLCWLLFADDYDDDGGAIPATIGGLLRPGS